MFSFKKQARENAFALGKVPGHPEFLRAPDALGAGLDTWLDAGWQAALTARGVDWAPAFAAGAVYGFLWNPGPKAEQVACGVIAPSTDSLGRGYPLVVASPVATSLVARHWPMVPAVAEGFLADAHSVMLAAEESALGVDDITRRVAELHAPVQEDFEAGEADYATWCEQVSLEEGWRAVVGESDTLAVVSAALDSLADALAPTLRKERPTASVLLRLPFGAGGPRSATLWLDVVRRMGHWKQTVPSAFWAVEDGSMLLAVAPPGPATLRELWQPDATDEQVFDLGALSDDLSPGTSEISKFISLNRDAKLSALLEVVGA